MWYITLNTAIRMSMSLHAEDCFDFKVVLALGSWGRVVVPVVLSSYFDQAQQRMRAEEHRSLKLPLTQIRDIRRQQVLTAVAVWLTELRQQTNCWSSPLTSTWDCKATVRWLGHLNMMRTDYFMTASHPQMTSRSGSLRINTTSLLYKMCIAILCICF